MNTATLTRPQNNVNQNQGFAPSPFVIDMKGRMARAGESFGCWQFVVDALTEKKFSPADLVKDFVRDCPLPDVKQSLLGRQREFILALAPKELPQNEGRLGTFVTTSSLCSAKDFLKAANLLKEIYDTIKVPMPKELMGRISACNRVHVSEEGGGYNHADLVGAGYEKRVVNNREAYIHLVSGDVIILPGAKKLTGGALLSPEEIAKRQAINAELRAKGKAARVKVVVKTPKVDKKAKRAEAEAAKNKRK